MLARERALSDAAQVETALPRVCLSSGQVLGCSLSFFEAPARRNERLVGDRHRRVVRAPRDVHVRVHDGLKPFSGRAGLRWAAPARSLLK